MWEALHTALTEGYGVLSLEWKASKSDFGWMCVLKQKRRTVVYLTPERESVRVGIVLGERAAANVLASGLPQAIRTMVAEAKPYAEGRGIRLPVSSVAEVPVVMEIIAAKMAP